MSKVSFLAVGFVLPFFSAGAFAQSVPELLKGQLNPAVDAKPQAAAATVVNQTPSGWNVIIRGAGATFNYAQGSPDTVQKNEINLGSGQSVDIVSPKTNCATYIRVAAAVQADTEPPQVFAKDLYAEAGKCLLKVDFVLKPKLSVPQSSSRKALEVIELQVVN